VAARDRVGRLVRLIDLLAAGRAHSADDLAELCRVSRRTVFRDLRTLRESGLPVRFDEGRRGFLLDRPPYLRPMDFSLAEALSLLVLCDRLAGTSRGIAFQGLARSAALKLLSALPPRLREHVGERSEQIDVRIAPVNPLKGLEDEFRKVERALAERRHLRIVYDSYSDKNVLTTLLSPYRLMFHRRSWYVVGRSSIHRAVRTFNVGRIRKSEPLDSHYEIPPRFSLDRHFGKAWSFIRDRGERHEVVVRFQERVARNVADVVWHKTQELSWNDDKTLNFTVTVDGLREIVHWVLRYGSEAEVLRPEKLRAMIREHVAAMAAMYAETPLA
jgi:proteasome accessory factor B